MYSVYDRNFQRISIDFLDYLNSKVVASEFVDYETKTIVPNLEGKIEIKHRMKRKMVDKDDFDLIDLHPDYRLSSSSRRIPFLNQTDSVRISMGTSIDCGNKRLLKIILIAGNCKEELSAVQCIQRLIYMTKMIQSVFERNFIEYMAQTSNPISKCTTSFG